MPFPESPLLDESRPLPFPDLLPDRLNFSLSEDLLLRLNFFDRRLRRFSLEGLLVILGRLSSYPGRKMWDSVNGGRIDVGKVEGAGLTDVGAGVVVGSGDNVGLSVSLTEGTEDGTGDGARDGAMDGTPETVSLAAPFMVGKSLRLGVSLRLGISL